MMDASIAPTKESDVFEIDPFAFMPAWRSRIAGLGGQEVAPDAGYGFHTSYVQCGPGALTFIVRFDALVATVGTLNLTIYALSPEVGPNAVAVQAEEIALCDIAAGGEIRVETDVLEGAAFALLGNVYDETDAAAGGLFVSVIRQDDTAAFTEKLISGRRTVFASSGHRRIAHLLSDAPATLADPVSQMCTFAQFQEPVYAEWTSRMNVEMHRHRKQWEFVYILQSLHRHGALTPGARGLGFGVGTEPLPAVMAKMGCTILATDLPAGDVRAADWNATNQHGANVDNLRRPDICPDDAFYERVSFRAVDMTMPPADLIDFDFTWSSCAYEHLGSIPAGLKFVEDSLRCLRPGGLAVHTTEFNLSSNDRTVDEGGTVLFRRRDIEDLARTLTAQGHEVFPLKYDPGAHPLDLHVDVAPYRSDNHLKLALSEYVTTSFGIIVRKSSKPRGRILSTLLRH